MLSQDAGSTLAHVSATGSVKPLKTSYYTYSSLSVLEVRLHCPCWVCIYFNISTAAAAGERMDTLASEQRLHKPRAGAQTRHRPQAAP